MVMSQEAYNKFAPELKPNGHVVVEQDLVRVSNISAGDAGVQLSGDTHRRRLGQAHGAELSDGGIF